MTEIKQIKSKIYSIIGKLDNGSNSSSQLQAADEALVDLFTEERNKLLKEVGYRLDRAYSIKTWGNYNVWSVFNEVLDSFKEEATQGIGETKPDNWDSKEGQTSYCIACELEIRGELQQDRAHNCGKGNNNFPFINDDYKEWANKYI